MADILEPPDDSIEADYDLAAEAETQPLVEWLWSLSCGTDSCGLILRIRERVIEATRSAEAQLAERTRERDEALQRIANTLGLQLPANEPVRAIELDIKRLLGTVELWTEACALAREHCPVGDGESHIRQGIPRLARERDAARAEVAKLREALEERETDMHMRIRADYDKTVADCWRAKVAKLEEALQFYADPEQWSGHYGNTDNGRRARQALAKETT